MWLLKEPDVLTTELLGIFEYSVYSSCVTAPGVCYQSTAGGICSSFSAVSKLSHIPPLLPFSRGLSPVPGDADPQAVSARQRSSFLPLPSCSRTCYHVDLLTSPPFHSPRHQAWPPHPVLLISSDNRYKTAVLLGLGIVWYGFPGLCQGQGVGDIWKKIKPY